MQPRVFQPLLEAFLILDQPRQRLSHWTAALAPLDDRRAPPFAAVTAYYDPTCDQALLGMRYDELALGPDRLAYVVDVALLAEIGMIQPSELSEGDRRRFLGERLARCTLSVTDQRNIVNALSELVRRVREQKLGRPLRDDTPVPKPPPADPIPMLAAARGRRTTQASTLSVQPKSTRDELARLRREQMASLAKTKLAKSTRELAQESRVATAKMRTQTPSRGTPTSRESRTVVADPVPAVPIARGQTRPGEARRPGPPPSLPALVQRKPSPALEARRLPAPTPVRPVRAPSVPPPPPEPLPTTLEARQPKITARMTSPHVIPREPAPTEPELPVRLPGSELVAPHVHRAATVEMPQPGPIPDAPHLHRAATVQMAPDEAQRLAAAAAVASAELPAIAVSSRATADLPVMIETRAGSADPFAPDPNAPAEAELPATVIYARYLRAGRWLPLRIGALSLRGAALMASALPRLHDEVEIAFAFAEHRALVRGPVHKVSTLEEIAHTGAAGFSVTFELDDAARRQLTALLVAARAAKVTIKPPPVRGNRRYHVEWPVCLGTHRGAIRADALDVSRGGLFVRPAAALVVDTHVSFSAVLDDGASPVSGRARVMRFISEADARNCGLAQGYGLKVTDMAELDRERWSGFLSRIEQRAEKRVLIGAAAGRLLELQTGLAAAGYVVTGATEPDALVALASQERAADACLLDAEWLPPSAAGWAAALFPARDVPCVTLRGDVRRARTALDQALSIV